MKKIKSQPIIARANIDSSTIDKEAKEFDVVFATENPVLRSPWWADETFNEVLVCDKKSIRAQRLDAGVVPLLDMHNDYSVNNQYGIVRTWSVGNGECRARVRYTTQPSKAEKWDDIEQSIIKGISVRAKVFKYDRVPNSDPKQTPTYRAVDWEVLEISLAPVPADFGSSVRGEDGNEEHDIEILNYKTKRAMLTPAQLKEIRNLCRAANLDEDYSDNLVSRCIGDEALSMDAARAAIEKDKVPAPPKNLTQEDLTRATTEERERISAIRTVARSSNFDNEEFLTDLINRGLTIDVAKARILDKIAESDRGPASGGGAPSTRGDEKTMVVRAMVEGLMHQLQPGSVTRYNEAMQVVMPELKGQAMLERAHDFQHMSMVDLCRATLELHGDTGTRRYSNDEVVTRYFKVMRTLDQTALPDLFTSTMQRFMRRDWQTYVPEWKQFSTEVPANDFRVKTGTKFDQSVTFEEIGEDGEYKESTLMSNDNATIQLAEFGRKFAVTRKTIINDDKAILTKVPKNVATGYEQFQSKKFWAMITGNALCPDGNPLFHPSHKNLATGAKASYIDDDSLSAARVAMMRQKSPQGNEVSVDPKYLLVPPELITPSAETAERHFANCSEGCEPVGLPAANQKRILPGYNSLVPGSRPGGHQR